MKIHHLKRCPLSKSNSFDQNFMKLGHIVKYHDVFLKFDNGPYCTMFSVVMAICLWKFTIWNNIRSLSLYFWSEFYETWSRCLVPWCLLQVWYWSISHHAYSSYGPLFMKIQHLKDVHSLSQIVLIRILWNLVTLFSTMMSSSKSIIVHIAPCFQKLWPFVYENSLF